MITVSRQRDLQNFVPMRKYQFFHPMVHPCILRAIEPVRKQAKPQDTMLVEHIYIFGTLNFVGEPLLFCGGCG